MLCETRLMNEESVPDIAGYCNVQSSRRGFTGRSSNGGVATLCRNYLEGVSVHRGDDFVAQTIRLEKRRWVFISFYVKHGTVRENTDLMQAVAVFIRKDCCPTDCIVLGGDAHLVDLDGISDRRGRMLESFCIENGLTILNRTDACCGKFTRGGSCIDYFIVNDTALRTVESMTVDEEREIAISDHNLLELICACSTRREKPKKERIKISNSETAASMAEQSLAGALGRPPETYHVFKACVAAAVERSTRSVKRSSEMLVHTPTIRELVRERRRCCRIWRRLRKLNPKQKHSV